MAENSKKSTISAQHEKKPLRCLSLHDYLKTLSSTILNRLYTHPVICLAVYRELSEIAKHFVIRILFLEQPVPQAIVASWISKAYAKEHKEAVGALSDLHIWQESPVTGGLPAWSLNPVFKKNAKVALLGGGKSCFMSSQLEADSKPRDIAFLDTYAMERWECVLHYMVGSHQQEGISADAVRVLVHGGLMKCGEDGNAVITKDGFQFLLMDTSSQVWYFILQYLDAAPSRGFDLSQCITFLFQLRFSILGKDYSTDEMSESLLCFLQHLREFGLVYQRKRKAGRFYPTRLALSMSSGKDGYTTEATKKDGFIVVETNYRVYAYTTSNLKVALVALFTEIAYRFPDVAVGLLTRESIRAALRSGITADQIVGYLRQHAHPKMIKVGCPILPPTVVDQIYLWEKERNRFIFTEGVLYSQFLSNDEFEMLRNYAQDSGVLIWQNERRRTMVVMKTAHDEVRKFWKKQSRN